MVHPPIHWFQGTTITERPRLSDIEYLAKKEFDGKLVRDDGFRAGGATGDLATLTATAGKDMYLGKATVVATMNQQGGAIAQVVLKINGTIEETFDLRIIEQTVGSLITTFVYEFTNIGRKVLATQIIKLEVITSDVDLDLYGIIVCFEETTGADPRI